VALCTEKQVRRPYTPYATSSTPPWRISAAAHHYLACHLIGKPRDLYLSSFRCMAAFVRAHRGHAGALSLYRRADHPDHAEHREAPGRASAARVRAQQYTLRRLFRLFLSMFLNFSVIPLRIASIIGVLTAVIGIIGLVMVILEGLAGPADRLALADGGDPSRSSGVQLIGPRVDRRISRRAFLTLNQKTAIDRPHRSSATTRQARLKPAGADPDRAAARCAG